MLIPLLCLILPLLTLAQQDAAVGTTTAATTNFVTRTLIQVYTQVHILAPSSSVLNASNTTTSSFHASFGTVIAYTNSVNSSTMVRPARSGVAGLVTGSPILPTKGVEYRGVAGEVKGSCALVLSLGLVAAVVALI